MEIGVRNGFIESMSIGYRKLEEAPEKLDAVARVLANFGQALSEFSAGKVGIACVTKDGGHGLVNDFVVGRPLNVVLVSLVDPDLPRPIVAELEVSPFGFPARLEIEGLSQSAVDEHGVVRLLNEMAASSTFAAAAKDLMGLAKIPKHLLS